MLTVRECEAKFLEIRKTIDNLPNTSHSEEYIKHLKRLRDAYSIEHIKAINREWKE